jgi:hypothetical protein
VLAMPLVTTGCHQTWSAKSDEPHLRQTLMAALRERQAPARGVSIKGLRLLLGDTAARNQAPASEGDPMSRDIAIGVLWLLLAVGVAAYARSKSL